MSTTTGEGTQEHQDRAGKLAVEHFSYQKTQYITSLPLLLLSLLSHETRLAWSSMNSGDVFLLDMGLTIYVWNGSQAGRLERVKGMDIARRIRDEERGGKAEIEVMGESNEFSSRMNSYMLYDAN